MKANRNFLKDIPVGITGKISDLPSCVQRFGRFYDRTPVIACGYRKVSIEHCVGCGGFTTAMLKEVKT